MMIKDDDDDDDDSNADEDDDDDEEEREAISEVTIRMKTKKKFKNWTKSSKTKKIST